MTSGPAAWLRRSLVGLWLLVFVVAGVALAVRWDTLMSRLARPPLAGSAAEGALR
ncbi:MAG: hypothetical protein ACM3PV_09725 [Betaproteobacteria bacterium]